MPHPSADANTEVTIDSLQIAGDPERVRDWLGLPATPPRRSSTSPSCRRTARRACMAVTFDTPNGEVTI